MKYFDKPEADEFVALISPFVRDDDDVCSVRSETWREQVRNGCREDAIILDEATGNIVVLPTLDVPLAQGRVCGKFEWVTTDLAFAEMPTEPWRTVSRECDWIGPPVGGVRWWITSPDEGGQDAANLVLAFSRRTFGPILRKRDGKLYIRPKRTRFCLAYANRRHVFNDVFLSDDPKYLGHIQDLCSQALRRAGIEDLCLGIDTESGTVVLHHDFRPALARRWPLSKWESELQDLFQRVKLADLSIEFWGNTAVIPSDWS